MNAQRNSIWLLSALAAMLLLLAGCGDDDSTTVTAADDPVGNDGVASTTLDPSDSDGGIPDLPVNDDPKSVTCTGDPGGLLDATKLVDLELEAAEMAAQAVGCSVRVVIEDGEGLARTEDFRPDRVNVETEDGVVIAIESLG